MEKIIVALIALAAGAIGSLAAPWANWGVERARHLRQRRAGLIDEARIYVNSNKFGVSQFARQSVFSQLREHLNSKLLGNIESYDQQCASFDNDEIQEARESIRQEILSDIKSLEKTWKLI